MAQIICLANSWKRQDRCIAGIEINTGKWIRPVYPALPDGRIPLQVRSLAGKEPQILDIIDLPLDSNICQSNYALENQNIMSGKWSKLGTVKPIQLVKYTNIFASILHNRYRYVTVSFLKSLPFFQRRTLQIIYTSKLKISASRQHSGRIKWKGSAIDNFGSKLIDASITDPVFVERLASGYKPSYPCLITVSLSLPFCPNESCQIDSCWKLIAGVVELC